MPDGEVIELRFQATPGRTHAPRVALARRRRVWGSISVAGMLLTMLSACSPFAGEWDPPNYFTSDGEHPHEALACVRLASEAMPRPPVVNWITDDVKVDPIGGGRFLVSGATRDGRLSNSWTCETWFDASSGRQANLLTTVIDGDEEWVSSLEG